jgi:hypothetical protein
MWFAELPVFQLMDSLAFSLALSLLSITSAMDAFSNN